MGGFTAWLLAGILISGVFYEKYERHCDGGQPVLRTIAIVVFWPVVVANVAFDGMNAVEMQCANEKDSE